MVTAIKLLCEVNNAVQSVAHISRQRAEIMCCGFFWRQSRGSWKSQNKMDSALTEQREHSGRREHTNGNGEEHNRGTLGGRMGMG